MIISSSKQVKGPGSMKKLRRTLAVSLAMTTLILTPIMAACSPLSSTTPGTLSPTVSCDSLLAKVVERHRTGDVYDEINAELDALTRNCSTEYDIATDYFGISSDSENLGIEACTYWEQYRIHPEAIALLKSDGLCTDDPPAPPPEPSWPEDGLGWNHAHDYVDTYQRVCGPMKSSRVTYDGIFVNVGQDYPSSDRFTFIIWGDWWMDPIAPDAIICASGNIYLYEGVTQMELGHPNEFEIWH